MSMRLVAFVLAELAEVVDERTYVLQLLLLHATMPCLIHGTGTHDFGESSIALL